MCVECGNSYCKECSETRHANRLRAGHTVKELENLLPEDEEGIASSQTGEDITVEHTS